MVQINFAQKSVTTKIVYYGPGMSGKTTNLEIVHQRAPESNKGDLTSISTDGDRTLFFDFMPLDLGTVAGMRTQFQIYTVPGQVYYNSTRKLVLQGVDGVIFIADSSASMLEENLESLANLAENLIEYGKDIDEIPLVIQYNKRDLPDAMTVEDLEKHLNPRGVPSFEAMANSGHGVFPTLKSIAARVLDSIHEQTGASSAGASSAIPGQPARAGATAPPAPTGAVPLSSPMPTPAAATPFAPPAPVPQQQQQQVPIQPALPAMPQMNAAPPAPQMGQPQMAQPPQPMAPPQMAPPQMAQPQPMAPQPMAQQQQQMAQPQQPQMAQPQQPPAPMPMSASPVAPGPVGAAPVPVAPMGGGFASDGQLGAAGAPLRMAQPSPHRAPEEVSAQVAPQPPAPVQPQAQPQPQPQAPTPAPQAAAPGPRPMASQRTAPAPRAAAPAPAGRLRPRTPAAHAPSASANGAKSTVITVAVVLVALAAGIAIGGTVFNLI